MTTAKVNCYDESFMACEAEAVEWEAEHGVYIRSVLCCKPIAGNKRDCITSDFKKFEPHSANTSEEIKAKMEFCLCVLPTGHTGKCCKIPHAQMFVNGALGNKFDTGIYSTPGNDGIVFKNRASRLFPIAITDASERKIKNKEIRLACCIPLKDRSKPLMLASAYLDCLAICANICDIGRIKAEHSYWDLYKDVLPAHKNHLAKYFADRNRSQFDKEGKTICPVTGHIFTVEDFTRDSRIANRETDPQLGHCLARSEERYTIRGFNISFMTREGNRLVGDHDFFKPEWINKLKNIVSRF